MGDEPRRRPQRRSAANRTAAQPSAAHYVGYVEDEETPESIARKFEELERIQARLRVAAAANAAEHPAGDDGTAPAEPMSQDELTEEQLNEVFQQTSSFTVGVSSQLPVPKSTSSTHLQQSFQWYTSWLIYVPYVVNQPIEVAAVLSC